MGNILIGYDNAATEDNATMADGSYAAALPVANAATDDVGEVARTANVKRSSTRFRCTLAELFPSLRVAGLRYHNLSANARVRMRAGRASLDLLFDSEDSDINDSRLTKSGGTNGTRVNSRGRIVRVTRTNLLLRSQEFDNASWTKTGATVTANATTSPDGTLTTDRMVGTAASSFHCVSQTFTGVAGSAYTASIYAQYDGTCRYFGIRVYDGTGGAYWATFDLVDGVVTNVESGNNLQAYMVQDARGFYRCIATWVSDASNAGHEMIYSMADSAAYTGASWTSSTSQGIYLWGAQLEENADATTYIPTTSATVTSTESGRINYGARRENLVFPSEDFSTWAGTFGYVVNTTVAPDGQTTGDYVGAGAGTTTGPVKQVTLKANTTYTFSVWAKQSSGAGCRLRWYDGTTTYYGSDVALTSSWQRLTMTFTTGASVSTPNVGVANPSSGLSTAWILWGAQLEKASTAGYYLPTTTAARVDLAPWRTNLLPYSAEVHRWDNTLINGTGVAPTLWPNELEAPDGTLTATRVTCSVGTGTTSSDYSFIRTLNNSTFNAGSVASGYTHAQSFYVKGTAGEQILARGVLAGPYQTITFTGEWQRVTWVEIASVTYPSFEIGIRQGIIGTLSSSVTFYIWGAQLENYLEPTPYIATTTQARTVADECLGLLVEEARTNVALRSNELDNASWGKADCTITANATLGPDGTQTMDKIVESATTAAHYPGQTVTLSAGATAFSGYFKAAERSLVWLQIYDGTAHDAWFDLVAGTYSNVAAGVTAKIEAAGNGIYRCSISYTTGSVNPIVLFGPSTVAGNNSYAGNGSSGLYAGFLQCEAGNFPTSYIPTTSAAVTRATDVASVTGAGFTGFFSPGAGTLYAEATPNTSTSNYRGFASISDGTANNLIQFEAEAGTSKLLAEVASGGVVSASLTSAAAIAATTKAALAYSVNDFAACPNGGTVLTDGAGGLPTVTRLDLGALNGGSLYLLNGHIKRVTYYPERLKNSELVTLTTDGPDALGFNSGWFDALRFSFADDAVPAAWGRMYDAFTTMASTDVRYLVGEIDDTANADGYVEFGRLYAMRGVQFEYDAGREGFRDYLVDLSDSRFTPSGRKHGPKRDRVRCVDFALPFVTAADAEIVRQMQHLAGTREEVAYVFDPDDLAESQKTGGLFEMQELSAIEFPLPTMKSTAFRLRQKR